MSHFQNYKTAAAFTRNRLGVKKLSSQEKLEIESAVEKHNQRKEKRYTRYIEVPVIEVLKKKLISEVAACIEIAIEACGYRKAGSRWAGGETILTVKTVNSPCATGVSRKVYSANGKWSGNNCHLQINVMPAWRKHIASVSGLATAGGMLTTHATPISNNTWIASWITQGKGFDINSVSGVIVRVGGNYYHGKDESTARKVAVKSQAEIEIKDYLSDISVEQMVFQFGEIRISRNDSLKVNCETGTDSWIELNFPNKKDATITQVLEVDSNNDRVVQACKVAIRRHCKSKTLQVLKSHN